MVIYLPGQANDETPLLDELTPREIVRELDKHVIGQAEAKRAVAIALRNRIRRQKLAPEMAEEVMPKNILMIGPTGVGKTELARRLAKLANSPFMKVEASKFTEVGYVGRDVESMIRDLVDIAIDMVREERLDEVAERVETSGIIFLDEIDKIAGREGGHGPDVSREGVQRDILPIVEGTTVNTRHGFVRTDHILFIAAGAFHVSKPSDMIPELQGRFPIRVERKTLSG